MVDLGKSLLISTTAGSLFPSDRPRIVSVTRTDPLATAFQKMIEHKILSVPVFDRQKGRFTCFLDMVDVVAFAVKKFLDQQTNGDVTKLMEMPLFSTVTCGEVSDLSRRNPFLPVEGSAPLLDALKLMVKWNVHRIPIVDAEGELLTILTQSQVVSFIYKYLSRFNENLLQQTAASMAAATGPKEGDEESKEGGVITVNMKDRAIDGFIAMHDKRVSAVAVVDNDGKIVGNLSASDLKTIGYDGSLVSRLFYPVSEFGKLVSMHSRAPSLMPASSRPSPSALSPGVVSPDLSFSTVVGELVNGNIHRVYMVDAEQRPIGVIGFSEVLRSVQSVLHC